MAYDIGQMVRLPVTVKDAGGALTNATMSIVVTRPDETVYPAPAIVNDSTGLYHADVVPDGTAYGPWLWRYTASGAAVGVYTGQFFVRTPGPRIVSLVEAKKHLNKDLNVTTDDEEIRDFIDACQYVIEFNLGYRVVPRTVVEYFDGGDGGVYAIHLQQGPVISVTEVREQWSPGDQRILTAEPDTAVGVGDNNYILTQARQVMRRNSGYPFGFAPGSQNIKVTYVVGFRSPLPNVRLAMLELLGHVWRASQLAAGLTRTKEAVDTLVATGYAVPNRVRELLGAPRAPRLGG